MKALKTRLREVVRACLLAATGLCVFVSGCATQGATAVGRSYWTKEAYERAEPRLKRAKIGMTFNDFTTLIDMKLMTTGGTVTGVLADGWLTPATESWVSGQIKVNEYVFGYVEGVNVVKKVVARFENKTLASVRFLANKGLSEFFQEERQTFTEENVEFLYGRDAYAKAAERAKGLKPAMDHHTVEQVMNLRTILGRDGEFFFLGQGLLPELAEQGKPDPGGSHRLKKIYFGYRDGDRPVPKIAVSFEDGKVSAIHRL